MDSQFVIWPKKRKSVQPDVKWTPRPKKTKENQQKRQRMLESDLKHREEEKEAQAKVDKAPEPTKRRGPRLQFPKIVASLYPHQVEGTKWMIKQEHGEIKGGILADDQGLGKAVMALSLVCSKDTPRAPSSSCDTTLIVCPTSSIHQVLDNSC